MEMKEPSGTLGFGSSRNIVVVEHGVDERRLARVGAADEDEFLILEEIHAVLLDLGD
jgi:hypothetical protein